MRIQFRLLPVIIPALFFQLLFAQNNKIDKRLAGLDTMVNRALKEWHAPGVSIAVVEKNKIIYTGGFGFRDIANKLPVTPTTMYAIGSCSKAFTGAMIGMLVNEGKINLDKPVRTYLPELKFANDYLNDHVTIRDMLCHRTGLPRHDLVWYGSAASRSELLQRIQYLEPTAELREKYQYNNLMFMSLGVLIEKITGKSWEENVKERILTPLGMMNTVVTIEEMEKAADRSLAYDLKDDSIIRHIPFRNINAIAPAGAINSCAKDMSEWLITWINSGKFEGKEIFPSGYRNQAITEQMATGGGLPAAENSDVHSSGYGFAWGMGSYRGHYRVTHNGGIDGFISSTTFFPSDSIGIFVVSNQDGPVSAIRNFIADRMLKTSYRDWNGYLLNNAKKAKAQAKTIVQNDSANHKFHTKPSHAPSDYAGVYTNPGYGSITINAEKDSLSGKFNTFNFRLVHFHYDQFDGKTITDGEEDGNVFKFSFHTDSKGDIGNLTIPLEDGVKDIEFKKEIAALKLGEDVLQKYTGDYELNGVTLKVLTKNDKTLYLDVPGQPEYELVAIDKGKFSIRDATGFTIQFNSNDKNEIIELLSIQPNGTFKAIRKK